MNPILTLIRGLPGSGKTTFAKSMLDPAQTFTAQICEADQFFYSEDGTYNFKRTLLHSAHTYCQLKTIRALEKGIQAIVCNTFTERWEMEPYLIMAEENNCRLNVVDLYDAGLSDQELSQRNIHNVPVEAITRMRGRYQFNWWDSNTTPKAYK